MIPKYLSLMWAAIAPALGNHLWQSTVFAIMAGLLTLLLRKNHARAHYWLWLAASVKFLIPFSLLVGIGSHLAWSRSSASGLYFAMEEVSQPFTQPSMSTISRAAPSAVSTSLIDLLPALLAVWLCGFVVVLFVWYARWRRTSAAMQDAVPLREGREVETLRRLEGVGGMQKGIEMLMSRASLEPGVFGIARPVLIWPEGISEHLEDAHLEAILSHELWHVRRHDNLAAAIHMVVESIFWFHPLVWWLGARLIEERERACDEEVLELGSERQVYAESILKVCEFCVGSPLACVSGVTGADLKKRIVDIMSERVACKLDFSRKLLLSAAGLVAIALPIVFGLLNATESRAQSMAENTAAITPVYQVTSLKPNNSATHMVGLLFTPDGFTATGITVQTLIREAYGVEDNEISGAPSWLNSRKYDIAARVDSPVADELRKLSEDQRRLVTQRMLQALLADRFKLTLHAETKDLPKYALVIAENGPKLQEAKPGDTYPNGLKGPNGLPVGPHMMLLQLGGRQLTGQGVPLALLAKHLSGQLGHTVLDQTGLTGNYDFTLRSRPDEGPLMMWKEPEAGQQGTDGTRLPAFSGPAIFTAIQEQLGLKLESQTGPVK